MKNRFVRGLLFAFVSFFAAEAIGGMHDSEAFFVAIGGFIVGLVSYSNFVSSVAAIVAKATDVKDDIKAKSDQMRDRK